MSRSRSPGAASDISTEVRPSRQAIPFAATRCDTKPSGLRIDPGLLDTLLEHRAAEMLELARLMERLEGNRN